MTTPFYLHQSKYYSNWATFFYIGPDLDVGTLHVETSDGGGCYLLGGPVLTKDEFGLTEAANRLISFLPAGIHFFPKASQEMICEVVRENRDQINDSSAILDSDWGNEYISVYSNRYSISQCCDLLLSDIAPQSAVVFWSRYQKGDVLLATELARIYYGLSKEQRERLELCADWVHAL